jgi:hypothetical protein
LAPWCYGYGSMLHSTSMRLGFSDSLQLPFVWFYHERRVSFYSPAETFMAVVVAEGRDVPNTKLNISHGVCSVIAFYSNRYSLTCQA